MPKLGVLHIELGRVTILPAMAILSLLLEDGRILLRGDAVCDQKTLRRLYSCECRVGADKDGDALAIAFER